MRRPASWSCDTLPRRPVLPCWVAAGVQSMRKRASQLPPQLQPSGGQAPPSCLAKRAVHPVYAGRERIQSRGRLRKKSSRYVEILEQGAEREQAENSRNQEDSMRRVLAGIKAVRN